MNCVKVIISEVFVRHFKYWMYSIIKILKNYQVVLANARII
jgi:hypothetical protein